MIRKINELIDSYWKFDNDQQPMSSWHDKQDLLKALGKIISEEDEDNEMPLSDQEYILIFDKFRTKLTTIPDDRQLKHWGNDEKHIKRIKIEQAKLMIRLNCNGMKLQKFIYELQEPNENHPPNPYTKDFVGYAEELKNSIFLEFKILSPTLCEILYIDQTLNITEIDNNERARALCAYFHKEEKEEEIYYLLENSMYFKINQS